MRVLAKRFKVSKIDETGEKFLKELSVEYSKHFQSVGSSTIDRTLKKLKITRKKKVYLTLEKIHHSRKKTNL